MDTGPTLRDDHEILVPQSVDEQQQVAEILLNVKTRILGTLAEKYRV